MSINHQRSERMKLIYWSDKSTINEARYLKFVKDHGPTPLTVADQTVRGMLQGFNTGKIEIVRDNMTIITWMDSYDIDYRFLSDMLGRNGTIHDFDKAWDRMLNQYNQRFIACDETFTPNQSILDELEKFYTMDLTIPHHYETGRWKDRKPMPDPWYFSGPSFT